MVPYNVENKDKTNAYPYQGETIAESLVEHFGDYEQVCLKMEPNKIVQPGAEARAHQAEYEASAVDDGFSQSRDCRFQSVNPGSNPPLFLRRIRTRHIIKLIIV